MGVYKKLIEWYYRSEFKEVEKRLRGASKTLTADEVDKMQYSLCEEIYPNSLYAKKMSLESVIGGVIAPVITSAGLCLLTQEYSFTLLFLGGWGVGGSVTGIIELASGHSSFFNALRNKVNEIYGLESLTKYNVLGRLSFH